ncbi:TonB-dependent receptor [Gemmatirosa kalamazoonensis]|uniref:TonB-dependent receptor n=1 Tax=Gemmatirosa kalamazoonensis TaxID=861299 RepID=W0RIQ8_9BACT|nr:TonB-dependent receptor [Gemmatirosa kalamazoonensis]AHG90671.1 TonB-dependent receptor [Gemmatirosa kalamazoonensis]
MRSFATLVPALALLGARAAAQPPAPNGRDTTSLGPVVVTATRVPVAASTSSVTVLSGADLRARGVTRVADALREVPGMHLVQSGSFGGATSLFLRGGQSNYTKVLIDGVPANLPGGSYDLAFLTTDNVERIEIVRGPASVLYGSDAVSGVIQIFTRRGVGPATPTASARGGTYGTFDGDVGVAGGSARAGYSVGIAHHASSGLLPENNEFRNSVASALVRVRPDDRSDARLSARYSDGTFHYPTSGSGAVVPFQHARRGDRRLTVGLDAGRFLASRVEGRVALTDNETRGRSVDDPTAPADTQRFYSRSTSADVRRSGDARVNVYVTPADVFTAGIELSRQSEQSDGTSQFQRFAPSSTHFDERRANTAYYAQWVGRAGAALSYTASGRIDDNDRFGTFGTYRVGAGYALPAGTRLRAAVGTSFKEPLFSEQFTTSFTTGNPDLAPERATTWEAAVEQSLAGGRATLGATYFDQRFRNLVQYRATPTGSPAGPNYFNVASARANGVELEASVADVAGATVRAAYTYLHTRVDDAGFGASGTFVLGERLLRRPTRTASLTALRPFGRRVSAGATLNYVGARDDRDFASFPATAVVLGGYATLDASLDVRLLDAGPRAPVALTARVENALDRRYEGVFNFAAPGRTVLVGVRLGGR